MSVPMENIVAKFSPQRQKRIKENSAKLIEEYKSLQDFRKAVGLTQTDVAEKMSIKQVNVSQLESRQDMHISTLRKYVEALGGKLDILITIPRNQTS